MNSLVRVTFLSRNKCSNQRKYTFNPSKHYCISQSQCINALFEIFSGLLFDSVAGHRPVNIWK